MTDIALMPERDVLQRHNSIAANYTGQAAQPLTGNGIALVWHRRTAFLPFAKKFFNFQHFSPLEMTEFGRPTIDAGGDHGQRGHKFRVSVTLHDLGRKRRGFQSEFLAYSSLNLGIDMCVRADGAAYFADTNPLARLRETLFRAAEFVVHQRKLQAERDWLGMHAVAAPDHRGHFVPPRLVRDHRSERFQIGQKNVARLV